MNAIGNRPLLGGGKFIPEIHLRQPGFTYGAVDHSLNMKKG